MPTTFPVLRYQDARTEIRWLSTAFGFVELRAAKVCRCGHATEAHQRRSISSIKRDVKKKVFPRPEGEKILSRDPAHFTVRVPLDLRERFCF
jgi:hypothetical protein